MMGNRRFVASLISAAIVLAISPAGWAQGFSVPSQITAPDYSTDASAGFLSSRNWNTPDSDGRPAVYFYTLGMHAYAKGDFPHAVDMLKVAASWGYAAAAYNLGVMYFQGQGVKPDAPLGTAWMFIAADYGSPYFKETRHFMVTNLDDAERSQALADYERLQKTYAEKVAMRRAKAQWAFARTQKTGSRVGGATGELAVGAFVSNHGPVLLDSTGRSAKVATAPSQLLQGGSVDGSIAYRQFQQSDNPYDPMFQKNRTGTATVGPLHEVNKETEGTDATAPAPAQSTRNPPDHAPIQL